MSDEFREHIHKRVRNLQKRKQRLDRYEDQRAVHPESLNADQIAALEHKDSVETPLKELIDLLAQYTAHCDAFDATLEAKLDAAREEGRRRAAEEAQAPLKVVLAFLNLAARKSQQPSSPQASAQSSKEAVSNESAELEGIYHALYELYSGGKGALDAAEKLASGSEEPVVSSSTSSWKQLREEALASKDVPAPSFETTPASKTHSDTTISFIQEDELAAPDTDLLIEIERSESNCDTEPTSDTALAAQEIMGVIQNTPEELESSSETPHVANLAEGKLMPKSGDKVSTKVSQKPTPKVSSLTENGNSSNSSREINLPKEKGPEDDFVTTKSKRRVRDENDIKRGHPHRKHGATRT